MELIVKTHAQVEETKEPFVTTYCPMAGWKAILYWFNKEDGGFWEPWQTSPFAFPTQEKAKEWAKDWAIAEGIAYVD